MLPRSIAQPSTVIVNTDAHTQSGSHWLAIRLEPRSSTAFYFEWIQVDPYSMIIQTLSEATAIFSNLYSKGHAKCWLLTYLLYRPITNLDDFGCPSRESFVPGARCSLPCHEFRDKSCAARNARSLFGWLKYRIKTRECGKCTKVYTRHTAAFNYGIQM